MVSPADSHPSVTIQSLTIHRAPGIPRGFALEALSPQINLVYGPNASGKSTTARILRQLFWKNPPASAMSYQAQFLHSNETWQLQRDGIHVACLREGVREKELDLMPGNEGLRERYHLTLHDLLHESDDEFAKAIRQEMAGGYDVEAISKQLKHVRQPSQPDKLAKDLRSARLSDQQVKEAQQKLQRREETLAGLFQIRQAAYAALEERTVLDRIEETVKAQQDRLQIEAELSAMPVQLAKFDGEEINRLDRLNLAETAELKREASTRQSLDEARRAFAEAGLQPDDALRLTLDNLDALRASIEKQESAVHNAHVAVDRDLARREQVRKSISDRLSSEAPAVEALALLAKIASANDEQSTLKHDLNAERALTEWLGDFLPTDDIDRIRSGISTLRTWLREPVPVLPPPTSNLSQWLLIIAGILIIAEAIVIGTSTHPAGYVFALVGLGIIALALRPKQVDEQIDRRPEIARQYQALALPLPVAWEIHDVSASLNALETDLQSLVLEDQKAIRWGNLASRRQVLELSLQSAQVKRNGLEEELGMVLPKDTSGITILVRQIEIWLELNQDLIAQEAELERKKLELTETYSGFNELVAGIGYAPVQTSESTIATIRQLRQRLERAQQAESSIQHHAYMLDQQITPQLNAIAKDRHELVASRACDSEADVRKLAPQFAEYRVKSRALEVANGHYEQLLQTASLTQPIESWTAERIEAQRKQINERSSKLAEVVAEIAQIEAEVKKAKRDNTIDQSLLAVEIASQALRIRRETDISSAIGAMLAEKVRIETEEQNQPAVMQRAQQIFQRITNGKFALTLPTGNPPVFGARATETDTPLTLNDLSSATRVQLLVAVRLAFIEITEQQVKLPLMLDELLANADDHRSTALIDSALEFARAGRQIFYFTAQQDEVTKWQEAAANGGDVHLAIFDLGEIRNMATLPTERRIRLEPFTAQTPPEPGVLSREAYRALLSVPPIDPWATSSGGIHLWYLEPDSTKLHHLLSRGVDSWGQLQLFGSKSAVDALELDASDFARLEARALACTQLLDHLRTGRGKPLDSLALIESQVIREAFREQAISLLESVRGNAKDLLRAIRDGHISGFRKTATESLEAYFEQHGYTSDEQVLTIQEVRDRTVIGCDHAISRGSITITEIDRLLEDISRSIAAD